MGVLEEFRESLELNEGSAARRSAFDVVYAKCVDNVLRLLASEDEDVGEEFDTSGLYATYQAEVAKNQLQSFRKSDKVKHVQKSRDVGSRRVGRSSNRRVGRENSVGGGVDTELGQDR